MTQSIPDITIVGLGPGPAELRTLASQRALHSARHIYIRNHPGTDYSDLLTLPNVTDVGTFRDPTAPSGQRWQASARAVVDDAENGPVVPAIPGHARFGEMLTVETMREAHARGLSVELLDGVSMIDLLCTALDLDPVRERVQLMDGRNISFLQQDAPFDGGRFAASPRLPMLITHVYENTIMRPLTIQLLRILPPEHTLTLISEAGLPGESRETTTLAELDDHSGGPMLAIYVPPMAELDAVRDARTLQHIVARLRAPDGCPWDRKQSHETLRDSLVDEVYEILDAINAGDTVNLAEELGDLFLLICMHAQIAEENGTFTLEDVFAGISTKIVRRHPHVFGDAEAKEAGAVFGLWNQIKSQEKIENPGKPEKAADGQPHSMPALTRTARVLAKQPLPHSGEYEAPSADARAANLLEAIDAIVVAGDDPEQVLYDALAAHVQNTTS